MNLDDVKRLYNQPWRHHHILEHVNIINNLCKTLVPNNERLLKVLSYASLFHDAVYEPFASDNEEKSAQLWRQYAHDNIPFVALSFVNDVERIILSTKHPERCSADDERIFRDADWHMMAYEGENTSEFLAEYERNIFLEYQKAPVEDYVEGRLKFICKSLQNGLMCEGVARQLKALVSRKYTVGIYAGSFFPFHIGHLSILRKAERMFDKVIVAKGVNPSKKYIGDYNNVDSILKHHQVEEYTCQLVDYIASKRTKHCNPVLVRGLRNGYDLSAEADLMRFINEQADARGMERIPVAYIPCDREFEHVSSSSIRMLPLNDFKRYIPEEM